MKLLLGHSPDADDAFMFYAMAKGLVNLRGHEYEHILQDIETLNRRALRGELELTAVSIHGFAFIEDRYALCACGASMRAAPGCSPHVPPGCSAHAARPAPRLSP